MQAVSQEVEGIEPRNCWNGRDDAFVYGGSQYEKDQSAPRSATGRPK